MLTDLSLLSLLQLASPALPVGAYSYSEGLETLVDRGTIGDRETLRDWIERELRYGMIRVDGAIALRGYRSLTARDMESLQYWNAWASAARETEELRQQSWQMGNALMRLLRGILPLEDSMAKEIFLVDNCNFAIAFGIAAAYWQIPSHSALLGYLHSWASNAIAAGVKLIPLGQTAGQQLLFDLQPILVEATAEILSLADEDLSSCSWGLTLASMQHETQYSRLFRS